ncbi:TetR family transcriptional regulator [Streptomyces sp. NPDC001100]
MLSLRERTRLAVKAQVAEIALEMFLSRGFEQTTIEQIAKAAGCPGRHSSAISPPRKTASWS